MNMNTTLMEGNDEQEDKNISKEKRRRRQR